MGKHVDKALKGEILLAIKNGTKVSELAAKHDINGTTIYGWMKA